MRPRVDDATLTDCVELRRELHALPELSGCEAATAELLRDRLAALRPDALHTGVGGHGILARYDGVGPGKKVLLRCEIDALPIAESIDVPHASRNPGVAHKCGHDGHMATLVAVASLLARRRPSIGSILLLFQPSEETGEGASRVLHGPALRENAPDFVLALHNLPGFAKETVVLRSDLFAFASVGADIHLVGAESHAAEPEKGKSPAAAVAEAIQALNLMGSEDRLPYEAGAITVSHARLGEPAFGTAPGSARVFATFRASSGGQLRRLQEETERLVSGLGSTHGVTAGLGWREPFPPTVCDPDIVALIAACAEDLGLAVERPPEPFRWSEDFGHFTARAPGALFGLGAGTDHAALHRPEYDFPDELIGIGAGLLYRVAHAITSKWPEWPEPPASEQHPGGAT